jgi:hypothetical protein
MTDCYEAATLPIVISSDLIVISSDDDAPDE